MRRDQPQSVSSVLSEPLSRSERWLAIAVALLVALAVFLPPIAQDPRYHQFADTRTLLGVTNAMDVLSNAFFLVLGSSGLAFHLRGRIAYGSAAMRTAGGVFFAGFVLTALGSGYYHMVPNDAGLAWDRFGMVVAFSGVLGLAAAHRVSARAAKSLLAVALVSGVIAVGWFAASGSVTPYAVMQFGGIALVAALACMPSRGVGPNWTALIAAYALAKAFETADHQVFQLTGGVVSGHTLKHVAAALAVLAVLIPLVRSPGSETA